MRVSLMLTPRRIAALFVAAVLLPFWVFNFEKLLEKLELDKVLVDAWAPMMDATRLLTVIFGSNIAFGFALGGLVFAFGPSIFGVGQRLRERLASSPAGKPKQLQINTIPIGGDSPPGTFTNLSFTDGTQQILTDVAALSEHLLSWETFDDRAIAYLEQLRLNRRHVYFDEPIAQLLRDFAHQCELAIGCRKNLETREETEENKREIKRLSFEIAERLGLKPNTRT